MFHACASHCSPIPSRFNFKTSVDEKKTTFVTFFLSSHTYPPPHISLYRDHSCVVTLAIKNSMKHVLVRKLVISRHLFPYVPFYLSSCRTYSCAASRVAIVLAPFSRATWQSGPSGEIYRREPQNLFRRVTPKAGERESCGARKTRVR